MKDTPARELVAAVRVIAQGDALLSPSVTKRLIEEFARRAEPERGGGDGFLGQEFEGRLLTKFGVRDRVQAVVLAYETGLVRPGAPAKRNPPSE